MPPRKNNPNAPFVAKPKPSGDRNRMVIETPGVEDETERKGEFSDRIKYEPYTQLGPALHNKMSMERT